MGILFIYWYRLKKKRKFYFLTKEKKLKTNFYWKLFFKIYKYLNKVKNKSNKKNSHKKSILLIYIGINA
jgi:hypothetical protein